MCILDLVFPKTCLGCDREGGGYICNVCLAKVPVLKPVCPYCEKASIDGFTHIKCKRKFGLDGLISVWDYEGVIRKAILTLKYKYATEVGKELSFVFVRCLENSNSKFLIPSSSFLIPVPIHWHRKNVRGFNQSEEIGKLVAGEMGWGFNPDVLIKKKSTTSQASLTVEERKKNLSGVFSVASGSVLSTMHSVLIFDDVFTTGSTLKECAKVLKKDGAEKVWGMTMAR